jgi:hypothetical protein
MPFRFVKKGSIVDIEIERWVAEHPEGFGSEQESEQFWREWIEGLPSTESELEASRNQREPN